MICFRRFVLPPRDVHHAARAGRLVAGRSAAGGSDSVNFAFLPGLTRYHFHSYPISTAITKANDPTIPTLSMNGHMNRNQRSYGMPAIAKIPMSTY